MGLRDFFGVYPTPDRSDARKLRAQGGYGQLFAIDVATRSERAYKQLKALHNASRSDLNAFVASTQAVLSLARQLDAVDVALIEGSNGAFKHILDKREQFFLQGLTTVSPGRYKPIQFEPLEFAGLLGPTAGERSWAQRWVDENVDGPQRQDFLDLFERHSQLARATYEAWRGFRDTAIELESAAEKQRVVDAAAQVDAGAGAKALPEAELDKVREAQGLVSTISAGLDEAYSMAKPQLESLDQAPSPFALQGERGELELESL